VVFQVTKIRQVPNASEKNSCTGLGTKMLNAGGSVLNWFSGKGMAELDEIE
jgi:hypothetical protein